MARTEGAAGADAPIDLVRTGRSRRPVLASIRNPGRPTAAGAFSASDQCEARQARIARPGGGRAEPAGNRWAERDGGRSLILAWVASVGATLEGGAGYDEVNAGRRIP